MDFWSIDAKELELMHKERLYPPRFQVHVCAKQWVRIPICFQGTAAGAEDMEPVLVFTPANSGIIKCPVFIL